MRFPRADLPDQDHIFGLANKLTPCQLSDLLFGERRHGGKVVGVQRIGNGKLGLAQ